MSVDRIGEFRRHLRESTSERSFATAHGIAYLVDSTPSVYDLNYVWVATPRGSAAALAADADEAMPDRGHRRVIVDDGAPGLADDFAGLGYARSTHLVLARMRPPDRLVATDAIEEVPLERILSPRTQAVLREPWGDETIAAQLNEAKRITARAIPTTYFAAVVGDAVAGWCELRSHDGVAQIEDVEVLEEFRGRGLGRAIVQRAIDEATRAHDLVYLEALADDWPRELYAKLGFDLVDRHDYYTRLPSRTAE